MSLALVFIITGLIIGVGAFIFAAVSMVRGVTSRDQFSRFEGMFKRHVGAMIVIVFGGLLCVVGVVLAGLDILNRVIK